MSNLSYTVGLTDSDPIGYARQGGETGQWWEYTDRNFQRWFHQCIKQPGDPDATRADLADAYVQWVQYGKPDGKNGCGGPPPPHQFQQRLVEMRVRQQQL
jgi:hypothetical protein